MSREGVLVVISGFAGTGKGTVVKGLLDRYEQYALSVSMTTRQPRPGEVNGVSYFFVSKEEFEATIAADGLIEYARYVDNYYGTPKAYVEEQLKAGKDVILEIEIQGALQIKKIYPDAVLIFVMPPSAEELRSRLEGRGTETAEVIEKRMKRAAEEAGFIESYDHIVLNDVVDQCVEQTHAIIEAAHSAPSKQKELIERVRKGLQGK